VESLQTLGVEIPICFSSIKIYIYELDNGGKSKYEKFYRHLIFQGFPLRKPYNGGRLRQRPSLQNENKGLRTCMAGDGACEKLGTETNK